MTIRLEALKLAIEAHKRFVNISDENILASAEKYVKFIQDDSKGNSSVNPVKLSLDQTSRKK